MNVSAVRGLLLLCPTIALFTLAERGSHGHASATELAIRVNGHTASIDFFCPELVFYREQLEAAGLNKDVLKVFLASVTRQLDGQGDEAVRAALGADQARLTRAVLYVIAADEVPGLASQVLGVLRKVEDPLIGTAAELALAATVREDNVDEILQGVVEQESEHVRVACVRVLTRLGPNQFESELREILKHARSDELELVTAIALAECGRPIAVDSLISLLTSSEYAIRHHALRILRQWTNQDFDFDLRGKERDQAYAIRRWRGWLSSLAEDTLDPLKVRRSSRVLAVRGKELFELGPDGRIIHQQAGFNSLSEAIGLAGGHRLVTDFMGRAQIEYDENWNEVQRRKVPFQPRACHRLANGHTLVIGMSRFQIFDANGNAHANSVTFPGRTNFTGSRLTRRDRFLVTCNDTGLIQELDFSGKPHWTLTAENHPRCLQVLDNGQLLVADFRQAVMYSSNGNAVWRHALDGVRSAHQLPSGNILLGHPSGLSVIEPSGQVLWEMKQLPQRGSGFFAQLE